MVTISQLAIEKEEIEQNTSVEYQAAIEEVVQDYNALITDVNAANKKAFKEMQLLLKEKDRDIAEVRLS